ncbi:META domain-containing protein [Herpetosiphon sp. NSE202]|uniref:META domain-containing protein n=1 Tax=Herpetosiphon sp. NSE202 TaxID=3351349 RepID=UPI00363864F9
MRRTLTIFALFAALAGCGSASTPTAMPTNLPTVDVSQPGAGLTGSKWNVLQINGQALKGQQALPLSFEADGRASGHSGCNGYGGDARIDGDRLTLGPIMSTKMACADPELQQQETTLFEALEKVTSYKMAGDKLSLLDDSGTVMVELVKQA